MGAAVSHRLKNTMEGALAAGGDPATSPLYVFGPFLRLLVVSGASSVCFGAPIWMVVLTVLAVSLMYRRVMEWVPDGSGGSGLCEEEFGSWAAKINASITFIECTLTFLVSIAALVTFMADRLPVLGGRWERVAVAVLLSIGTGVVVNRGPRLSARVFGPATGAVLLLLWGLIIAVLLQHGLHLPPLSLEAFSGERLHVTLGGYTRLLALMTGIEVFANLVAAYEGPAPERARKAFGSMMIVMVTTLTTMLVVGPAILELSDPRREEVSVFTQTMDRLLPMPLSHAGTLVGIVVLLSAAAASMQAIQNLALGLRHRHYIPASFGQRNRYDVAERPVYLMVALVVLCLLVFGTHEETYLALYAAGVFFLLALTGWAAVKRQGRTFRGKPGPWSLGELGATVAAATLTSGAAGLIFYERFREGAWVYLLLVPGLYALLSHYRKKLGKPEPIDERLGKILSEQRVSLPSGNASWPTRILVVLDGSPEGEQAILSALGISARFQAIMDVCVLGEGSSIEPYVRQLSTLVAEVPAIHRIFRSNQEVDLPTTLARAGSDLVILASETARLKSILPQLSAPTLLLRGRATAANRHTLFREIVVGLDGSEASECVLPQVKSLLRAGGQATLVCVPEGEGSTHLGEYARKIASGLEEEGKVRLVTEGSGPARTLLQIAESDGVDLVVVATHGRGGADRDIKLGSVPSRLQADLQHPLLLVPVKAPPRV